jgi:hypothetical protein
VAVKVATAGGSASFSLTIRVKETLPDIGGNDNSAGAISRATAAMTLVPVGGGSSSAGVLQGAPTLIGADYDYAWRRQFTFQFTGVPVNTYTVQVQVNGGYYTSSYEDGLIVYDPSLLGFTTGGGHFLWPGTTDKTTFGFVIKYNKSGANVQGSLLLVRHTATGIYRLKSNSLGSLLTGVNVDSTGTWGWASFSGKATYLEPGWSQPVGNYAFSAYVEDRNEPGSGLDKFWIRVTNGIYINGTGPANGIPITNGNIVVPHTNSGKPGK